MKIKTLFLTLCLFITACTIRPNPEGWTEKIIETKYLSFGVWEKDIQPNAPLRIYIEGDGNPTPKRPIALEFAERDQNPNVIYVSRPCQYVFCDECKNPALWREERFNEEIVREMKDLIVYLAKKYQATELELIGYDGGATMAMLIATKTPVSRVITIGGILDTKTYATEQNIPINGMNPTDLKQRLASVTQVHYVGAKDTKTPRAQAERFVGRMNNPISAVVKVVPKATHTDWKQLTIE